MKEKLLDELMEVVKDTQMERVEYSRIWDCVRSISNCNFLIFGTGNDSKLWIEANKNGNKTVFLEPDSKWVKFAKEKSPNMDVRHVQFKTIPQQAIDLILKWKLTGEGLKPDLPKDIWQTDWDVIFVDSPVGIVNGRMQSIFGAKELHDTKKDKSKTTYVYVHDCERPIEMIYCAMFLFPYAKECNEFNNKNFNFKKMNEYLL